VSVNPADPTFGLRIVTPTPAYADLAVVGTATPQTMDPRFCLLGSTAGYHASNRAGTRAVFVNAYLNRPAGQSLVPEVGTSLTATPAFDEGGNFIDVRFRPLTLTGNYHLGDGNDAGAAVDRATKVNPFNTNQQLTNPYPSLSLDWDGNARPGNNGAPWDIGADER
jgi:hypothetical protein